MTIHILLSFFKFPGVYLILCQLYRVSRFYRFLWFASERYLIFRFSKDWCLIFFLNMGDLLFEQKIWLKVNFMVLYGIPKSNQGFWEFFNNLPEYHSFKPDCLALRCEKKHLRTVLKIFKFWHFINTLCFHKSQEMDKMLV